MKPYQTILIIYLTLGLMVGLISIINIFKKENKYVRDKLDATFWKALSLSFIYHWLLWPIVIMK